VKVLKAVIDLMSGESLSAGVSVAVEAFITQQSFQQNPWYPLIMFTLHAVPWVVPVLLTIAAIVAITARVRSWRPKHINHVASVEEPADADAPDAPLFEEPAQLSAPTPAPWYRTSLVIPVSICAAATGPISMNLLGYSLRAAGADYSDRAPFVAIMLLSMALSLIIYFVPPRPG